MSSCFYIKKRDFVFHRGFRLASTEEENMRKFTSNSPLTPETETTALSSAPSHANGDCYFEDCPLPSTPARSLI